MSNSETGEAYNINENSAADGFDYYKVTTTDSEGNVMTGYLPPAGVQAFVRWQREEYGYKAVEVTAVYKKDIPAGTLLPE